MKFIFSEKATKFWKNLPTFSKYVAFSKLINITADSQSILVDHIPWTLLELQNRDIKRVIIERDIKFIHSEKATQIWKKRSQQNQFLKYLKNRNFSFFFDSVDNDGRTMQNISPTE